MMEKDELVFYIKTNEYTTTRKTPVPEPRPKRPIPAKRRKQQPIETKKEKANAVQPEAETSFDE